MVSRKIGCGPLVVAVTLLSAGSLAAPEPCVVAYDDGRLTLHAEKVPLADVVREIGRQSGAEIVGKVRKPREVTRQFDQVPLFDALVRLLGEQNFTLRYGSEGKLRTINLLGEPLAAAAQTTPADDKSDPNKPAPTRRHRHHHDVRASRETLPDGQVLVSVAGTDTRNASNGLADDPARHGGPSEQAATTQEQWPAPDELDRKLRRSFLDFLGGMDEATLAQYLATPEGQRAQALLEDFAANHPSGRSNQKANGILDRVPGRGNQVPPGHK